jgi:flagellar hook protein FlgE
MALSSTLFTGLSGLNVNQSTLNVIGNNIANVNTVGFKGSRALAKPQFYVTDSAGSPPDAEFGGANPSQRGLGVVQASIEKDWGQGNIETTGKSTDIAIDGEGFFVIQGKSQMYTRDGSFKLNSSNELVTTGGAFVQGFGVDVDGNVVPGQLERVVIPIGGMTIAKATSNVKFIGNLKADGAVASGASILNSAPLTIRDGAAGAGTAPTAATPLTDLALASDSATALFTGTETLSLGATKGGRTLTTTTFDTAAMTVADLQSYLQANMAIDTTITPAPVPPPGMSLVTLGTDPAGSARLTITGNLGSDNALAMSGGGLSTGNGSSVMSFSDGSDGTNTSDPTGESVHTSLIAYDSLGNSVNVGLTAVLESKDDSGNTWRFYATSNDDSDAISSSASGDGSLLGNGTLTFDNEGKLVSTTGATITVDRSQTGAGTPITLNLDMSAITQLADSTGTSDLKASEQDGRSLGTLSGYSFGANGIITGAFTNGLTKVLGQVAIANFNNPQGLSDQGGNMFITGANSGVAIIGSPGSLGAGGLRAGALELSNVDLSEQFINMIVASTGFSAASRVITTSDQLIQELLNSAR